VNCNWLNDTRHLHLGESRPARSTLSELQAAYEKALAQRVR
jgi:hypothetical protein